MATINIAHKESAEAVERVRNALQKVVWTNATWSSTRFEIARDEFTRIDCEDEIAGRQLLHEAVFPALRGE